MAARFLGQEWRSATVRAIEARRLVEPLRDVIIDQGMPQPQLDVFGDGFAHAFDRWVADLAYWLRRSSHG